MILQSIGHLKLVRQLCHDQKKKNTSKLVFYIPVIAIILGFVAGYYFIQEAQAVTVIDGFTAKFVVTFDKVGITEAQISNYLKNTVWLDVRDILITKLDNNFITYDLVVKLKVNQINANTFQFYPKFIISGETSLSPAQLRNGFDATLNNIKDVIQVHLDLQSATNVSYHMHTSVGSVDVTQ